jgi:hypothetical protein
VKKKVLGIGIDGKDIVNFNVKLIVRYYTTANEKVKDEMTIPVQTTEKKIAESIAIEKAKAILKCLPYIVKNSVTIEVKRRGIKNGKD